MKIRYVLLLLALLACFQAHAQLVLEEDTASQAVTLGPFVDPSTGDAETGLTIANTDVRLSANGGNYAAKNSGGCTHDEGGMYTCTFDATDTATVGRLQVYVDVAGALSVYHEFAVVEELVYASCCAASAAPLTAAAVVDNFETQSQADPTGFHVNVIEIGGTAQTANDNGADINNILTDTGTTIPGTITTAQNDLDTITGAAGVLVDQGTGAGQLSFASGILNVDVDTVEAGDATDALDTAANTVTVTSMAANVLTASALAADAATEIIDNFETQSQADPTGFHVNVLEVGGTAQTAGDLGALVPYVAIGTCDSGTTATCVDATLTTTDTDYYRGMAIRFTSGTIVGQARCITAFTPASDTIAFVPPTTQAVSTNTYMLVQDTNCIGVDPTYTP